MELYMIISIITVSLFAGWFGNTLMFNIRNRNNEVYIIPKHVVDAMTEYMEDIYEQHEASLDDSDRDFNNLIKKFEEN